MSKETETTAGVFFGLPKIKGKIQRRGQTADYKLPPVPNHEKDPNEPKYLKGLARILLKDNMKFIKTKGYLPLDESLTVTMHEAVQEVVKSLGDNKSPYCGRNAYIGFFKLKKGESLIKATSGPSFCCPLFIWGFQHAFGIQQIKNPEMRQKLVTIFSIPNEEERNATLGSELIDYFKNEDNYQETLLEVMGFFPEPLAKRCEEMIKSLTPQSTDEYLGDEKVLTVYVGIEVKEKKVKDKETSYSMNVDDVWFFRPGGI